MIFIAIAGIIVLGARWWWTPLIGALIALLVTSGWFVRLPAAILRLTHPGSVGKFAAGIWIGAVLQIVALVVTDIAGLAATVQNYRRSGSTTDSAKMACRLFGGIFVLMGIMVIVGGAHADKYHNLMHLIWGALGAWRKLPGIDRCKALLHRIGCVLSGAGDPRPADRKSIDEQSMVSRANAVAHRRPYLSPGARFSLPRRGTCLWPGVETSPCPALRKLSPAAMVTYQELTSLVTRAGTELASCDHNRQHRNANHADEDHLVHITIAVEWLARQSGAEHDGAGIEKVVHRDRSPGVLRPVAKYASEAKMAADTTIGRKYQKRTPRREPA